MNQSHKPLFNIINDTGNDPWPKYIMVMFAETIHLKLPSISKDGRAVSMQYLWHTVQRNEMPREKNVLWWFCWVTTLLKIP